MGSKGIWQKEHIELQKSPEKEDREFMIK